MVCPGPSMRNRANASGRSALSKTSNHRSRPRSVPASRAVPTSAGASASDEVQWPGPARLPDRGSDPDPQHAPTRRCRSLRRSGVRTRLRSPSCLLRPSRSGHAMPQAPPPSSASRNPASNRARPVNPASTGWNIPHPAHRHRRRTRPRQGHQGMQQRRLQPVRAWRPWPRHGPRPATAPGSPLGDPRTADRGTTLPVPPRPPRAKRSAAECLPGPRSGIPARYTTPPDGPAPVTHNGIQRSTHTRPRPAPPPQTPMQADISCGEVRHIDDSVSPAWATADSAAATNERPDGNRRNSDVCDKNTRRGGGRSLGTTPIASQSHRSGTCMGHDQALSQASSMFTKISFSTVPFKAPRCGTPPSAQPG